MPSKLASIMLISISAFVKNDQKYIRVSMLFQQRWPVCSPPAVYEQCSSECLHSILFTVSAMVMSICTDCLWKIPHQLCRWKFTSKCSNLWCVQTGAARYAIQALLSRGLSNIYQGFAVQQLTAQCGAAQVILECCSALLRVIAALPSHQAPADMRIQRSPMWPCSQSSLLPTCTDIITPPFQAAAATHPLPPAAATAAGDRRAKQAVPDTEAVSAAAPVNHATPVTSLTRAQAVQVLGFLVTPPDGLVWGLLSNSSKPAGERKAALELLTAVYQCNSSSVTEDGDHAAFCAKAHATGLMRAYAEDDAPQCCQHLTALQALAKHKVGLSQITCCYSSNDKRTGNMHTVRISVF